MRKIDPGIWKDEFIIDLGHTERLLWIGLITTIADDQGRLQTSPRIIKAEIFPCDDIPVGQIENALKNFAEAQKIQIYEVNGKGLIQIINWWKYQSSAAWMGKSNYSPPQGWHDRYRLHVQGGGIETSENWESKLAGFVAASYLSPTCPLPSRDGDSNDNVNVEDDGEREGEGGNVISASSSTLEIFKKVTNLSDFPYGYGEAIKKLEKIIQNLKDSDDAIIYLAQVFEWWKKQPRKNGSGNYSILNPGWLDRALAGLSGEKPWEIKLEEEKSNDVERQVQKFLYHRK